MALALRKRGPKSTDVANTDSSGLTPPLLLVHHDVFRTKGLLPRSEIVSLYHNWDGARFIALFAAPPQAERDHETLDWMHTRLGECGAPAPMWSLGARNTRFSAPCERGALEVHLVLDAAGRIEQLRFGAAGIAPEEPLANAVQRVVAALPDAAPPDLKDSPWGRSLGRCTLDRPWVVSERSGLFHLRCDGGAAVLKLGVAGDGAVRALELWPPPLAGGLHVDM